MAILANRSRITGQWGEFIKFVLASFKKLLAVFLILLSIQLLYFVPTKKLSSVTLELLGTFISSTFSVYDAVIEQVSSFTHTFTYFKNLEAENIELKLEIAKLQQFQSIHHSIQLENTELRGLLPVVQDHKFDCIIARLLSLSNNAFSKTALIQAGSRNGVELDQIVTNNEGLIGRIIEVSDNYSKIMLSSDCNSSIPVISSISRERGILVGNGHELNMTYLSDNHTINSDESLITSGDGSVYPYGIEVAKVMKTSKDAVIAKSIINLSKIGFVVVHRLGKVQ